MTESSLALKCPHCNSALDARPPDSWHSTCSLEEPTMSRSHGEVKKQDVICPNGKCGKRFTVYWFAPMEYYRTM
jgi:hypothetical protein